MKGMQEYFMILVSPKLCSTEYLGFHNQTRWGNAACDSLLMKIPSAYEHLWVDGWVKGWKDN